jgi:hypothetical protein
VWQLALSKAPARMGIHHHGQRADIPSKGISYNKFLHALNILLHNVCVYPIKKRFHLCRLKINHGSGINTCIDSLLTSPHGCEHRLTGVANTAEFLSWLNKTMKIPENLKSSLSTTQKTRRK